MVELILVKRAARAGEIGLFCDAQPYEDDWSSLKIGSEVKAECTNPHNLKYLKFFWALATKVAENCDFLIDKDDAKERILLEARHFKTVFDPLRNRAEVKAKSIAGLSGDTWLRLLRRCTYVVITKFLPGMEENELKAEIEKMIGMDVFSAPPKGGEPQKPPEAAHETSPPAATRSGPTNEAEYMTACRKWIEKQTDLTTALDYYDSPSQTYTRVACKLSVGANKALRRELLMKFEKEGTK
jgi:hypothetical protein